MEKLAIDQIAELLFELGYTDDRKENYNSDIFDAIEILENLIFNQK